jgi:hypothetical protein
LKKTIVITLIFGLLINCGTVRNLNLNPYIKSDIRELAVWKYGLDLEQETICDLYVIDGMPFSGNELDSILSKYDKSDFGYIVFLKTNTVKNTFRNNPGCNLVPVFQTKENQTQRQKKEILKKVQNVFNENVSELIITDYKCVKCPVLIINNKLIWSPYDRKKIVNELNEYQVKYVTYLQQPLNEKNYGSSGKNGIVEITTK